MLRFLHFETTNTSDETTTLEAMASVRSDEWDGLWHEVQAVLEWVQAHCGTPPAPWEDGGSWDTLVTVQEDEQPSTVWHPLQALRQPPRPARHARWVCVTVTLTATEAVAQGLSERLCPAG